MPTDSAPNLLAGASATPPVSQFGPIPNISIYSEAGRTGLRRYGGFLYEEILQDLQGYKAVQVYREMAENDVVIGGCLLAFDLLMRQAEWRVEPASQANADVEAAAFLESCLDDLDFAWEDVLVEILSFVRFGYTVLETVYKLRNGDSQDPRQNSRYRDGRIGWRKLPIRAQETTYQWLFDDVGDLEGVVQQAPPDYVFRTIPWQKLLLFRTRVHKNNPEGYSLLRPLYRSWYLKKRIEEIMAVGIERDLVGLPMLQAPAGLDIWNTKDPNLAGIALSAQKLVRRLHRDELEGALIPFGWTLSLLSTGGRRQFDLPAVLTYYDNRLASGIMADFLLLGQQAVGSFALADSKTNVFGLACGAILDQVAATFNRHAIPRLFRLNPDLPQQELPKLVHGDVEASDLDALGTFLLRAAQAGALTPDQGLEEYVRRVASLPAPEMQAAPTNPPGGARISSTGGTETEGVEAPEETAEDEEPTEMAPQVARP